MTDPTLAETHAYVERLHALVDRLTRRVEEAEAKIAAMTPPKGWVAAVNWSATDGTSRYVCGHANGTWLYGVTGGAYTGGFATPYAAAAESDRLAAGGAP